MGIRLAFVCDCGICFEIASNEFYDAIQIICSFFSLIPNIMHALANLTRNCGSFYNFNTAKRLFLNETYLFLFTKRKVFRQIYLVVRHMLFVITMEEKWPPIRFVTYYNFEITWHQSSYQRTQAKYGIEFRENLLYFIDSNYWLAHFPVRGQI